MADANVHVTPCATSMIAACSRQPPRLSAYCRLAARHVTGTCGFVNGTERGVAKMPKTGRAL